MATANATTVHAVPEVGIAVRIAARRSASVARESLDRAVRSEISAYGAYLRADADTACDCARWAVLSALHTAHVARTVGASGDAFTGRGSVGITLK